MSTALQAEEALTAHLLERRYEDLPVAAIEAARTFIYDAIGVGISGARHPRMAQIRQAMAQLGDAGDASVTVWGSGDRLPLPSAVLMNAYQVFNQEFDAVHDIAVVHAFACIVPAALGFAEREGGVRGQDLIAAVALGLDVAIHIALAQRAPMRFFRPAMCGCLGATAALSRLAGLDAQTARHALGLAYSHLSGTMQAHIEGSPSVGLQVGLNARAAVTAFELARAGFPGPRDFLTGPYGYFALYDFGQARWDEVVPDLGRIYQITRMSHKPFPTGRATHGGIEGMQRLMAAHGFAPGDIEAVRIQASGLIVRLVGRAPTAAMDSAYAKLCMAYCVATAALTGTVGIQDFDEAALRDSARLQLAQRVVVVDDGNPDPNALAPQAVEVLLRSGQTLRAEVPVLLGNPAHPLPVKLQDAKFAACCASAIPAMADHRVAVLARQLQQLDQVEDVRALLPLMCTG